MHAKLALQAANDQVVDAQRLQRRLKLGAVEGVGRRLSNSKVAGLRGKLFIELPGIAVEAKRPVVSFMLDEDHRRTDGSCLGGHCIDSIDDPVDVEGGPLAGTKGPLNVDNEEGSRHAVEFDAYRWS